MRIIVLLALSLLSSLSQAADEEKFVPKIGGLLQPWMVVDDVNGSGSLINFRLRRAEIKLSGSVHERMRYFVMIDPAKNFPSGAVVQTQDNKILQDLGVGFTPIDGFEILMGQFKTPTTAEGLGSSAELLLPERSLPGRTYGDRREPGIQVTYTHEQYGKFYAMVSNGLGPNVNASANSKDLTLRYEVKPMEILKTGAFVVLGDFKYDKKGRVGVNAEVTPGDATIGAEFVTARDAGVLSRGVEAHIAYLVSPEWQPVFRFEFLEPNTSGNWSAKAETLGINYLLAKHKAKIQLAVSSMQNLTGNSGSPALSNGKNQTLGWLVFQAAL